MGNDNRQLTFKRIATTEDTGDPVIQAEFTDVGSHMKVIIDTADEILRVAFVKSEAKGDMSRILDEIVRQVGWTHVMFLTPLNDQLEAKLDGFTEGTEYIERMDDVLTYLEGEWTVGR